MNQYYSVIVKWPYYGAETDGLVALDNEVEALELHYARVVFLPSTFGLFANYSNVILLIIKSVYKLMVPNGRIHKSMADRSFDLRNSVNSTI